MRLYILIFSTGILALVAVVATAQHLAPGYVGSRDFWQGMLVEAISFIVTAVGIGSVSAAAVTYLERQRALPIRRIASEKIDRSYSAALLAMLKIAGLGDKKPIDYRWTVVTSNYKAVRYERRTAAEILEILTEGRTALRDARDMLDRYFSVFPVEMHDDLSEIHVALGWCDRLIVDCAKRFDGDTAVSSVDTEWTGTWSEVRYAIERSTGNYRKRRVRYSKSLHWLRLVFDQLRKRLRRESELDIYDIMGSMRKFLKFDAPRPSEMISSHKKELAELNSTLPWRIWEHSEHYDPDDHEGRPLYGYPPPPFALFNKDLSELLPYDYQVDDDQLGIVARLSKRALRVKQEGRYHLREFAKAPDKASARAAIRKEALAKGRGRISFSSFLDKSHILLEHRAGLEDVYGETIEDQFQSEIRYISPEAEAMISFHRGLREKADSSPTRQGRWTKWIKALMRRSNSPLN